MMLELKPEVRRWVEQRSEVFHDLILRKIEDYSAAGMPEDIANILLHQINSAYKAELQAGQSGRQDDGGAGRKMLAVEMFVHGWYKLLPRGWDAMARQIELMQDPEYQEYLRLKEKFGRHR